MSQQLERPCPLLLQHENMFTKESDLMLQLEEKDDAVKASALQQIIARMINGETFPKAVMQVIKFALHSDDHTVKKLVLIFWELVERTKADGKLHPEMILVCQAMKNNLTHPNEYIRGSTLRLLTKMKEPEIVGSLVHSITPNLTHRHAYVRKNAILAVFSIYESHPELIPDAPELVESVLHNEYNVVAKRNALAFLLHCDPPRAIKYLNVILPTVSTLGESIILVVLDVIRKATRQNPSHKTHYVRAVHDMLSGCSDTVTFEAASTLVALSSAPTAVRAAVEAYCRLLQSESDNNIRLIILARLASLRERHAGVLEGVLMDVLKVITTPNLEIRRRALALAMALVTSSQVEEMVAFLRKELDRLIATESPAPTDPYRKLLFECLRRLAVKYPTVVSAVSAVLLPFLSDPATQVGLDAMAFVREVMDEHPTLRSALLHRIISSLDTIQTPEILRSCLWTLGEFASVTSSAPEAESLATSALDAIFHSVGALPFPVPIPSTQTQASSSNQTSVYLGNPLSASRIAEPDFVPPSARPSTTTATAAVPPSLPSSSSSSASSSSSSASLLANASAASPAAAVEHKSTGSSTSTPSSLSSSKVAGPVVLADGTYSSQSSSSSSASTTASLSSSSSSSSTSSSSVGGTPWGEPWLRSHLLLPTPYLLSVLTTAVTKLVLSLREGQLARTSNVSAADYNAYVARAMLLCVSSLRVIPASRLPTKPITNLVSGAASTSAGTSGVATVASPTSRGGSSSSNAGFSATTLAATSSLSGAFHEADSMERILCNLRALQSPSTAVAELYSGGKEALHLAVEAQRRRQASADATGATSSSSSSSIGKTGTSGGTLVSQVDEAIPMRLLKLLNKGQAEDEMEAVERSHQEDLQLAISGKAKTSLLDLSRLNRVYQLTGFGDAVFVEAAVTVLEYDLAVDVKVVNQTPQTLHNLYLELYTSNDLRVVDRGVAVNIPAGGVHQFHWNIKVTATESGVICGNVIYDSSSGADKTIVVLNNINIDIVDFMAPATCSDSAYHAMWLEFEWENKVLVSTDITSLSEYLDHIIKITNMNCLTDRVSSECSCLAANLYGRSIFGEDALINISIEKLPQGRINGYCRIRAKKQGIAIGLGDKISTKQSLKDVIGATGSTSSSTSSVNSAASADHNNAVMSENPESAGV